MPKQSAEERRAAEVERAERLKKMVLLRKVGMTLQAIADQCGVNKSTVSRELDKAYKELYHEDANQHVQLELARLEELQRAIYPAALKGDVKAVNASVRVSESKRKLLGIDKPTKLELGLPDVDIDKAASEVMAAALAQAVNPRLT